VRLAGLAAAVALVLGGCGYAEDEAGAGSPREAFELFVTAVKEGDSKGAELVSEQLPSEHRAAFLREMRDNVQPLASGFRIVLDELVDERLAVVAAEGADGHAPGVFAAVLVREDEAWFIQPQSLDLLYGVSAAVGTVRAADPRIDFEVNAPGQAGRPEARLWIDGSSTPVRGRPAELTHQFVAQVRRLERGSHVVVAFARAGDRAHAIAWTVTAE
jgi:hypothetical protein